MDECPKCAKGAPKWLTTFSDMMSLLLCVFILLLSFANTDENKFQGITASVKDALGVPSRDVSNIEEGGNPIPIKLGMNERVLDQRKTQLVNLLNTTFSQEEFQKNTFITADSNGVKIEVIELEDNAMFESGEANILPGAQRVFRKLIPLLESTPYKVTIEGHTDNVPIVSAKYPSNWELSSARAGSVVRFFLQNSTLDPRRFTATGCADTRALFDNEIPENRIKNRRVSITLEVF